MKPTQFPEVNTVFGKDQPPYNPLPACQLEDGMVISCWQLTWRERFKMLLRGRLWLTVLTFNNHLQPLLPTIEKPIEKVPE